MPPGSDNSGTNNMGYYARPNNINSHQEMLPNKPRSGNNIHGNVGSDINIIAGQVQGFEPELSNVESRARMRVSKACDRCRTQKIKCSGTFPCTTCIKHKRECVYNNNNQVMSKQDEALLNPTILNAPTDRQLPYVVKTEDKAYIRHLEDRIQYLESRLTVGQEDLMVEPQNGETETEDTSQFCRRSAKWRFCSRNHILLVQELAQNIYNSLDESNRKKISVPRQQYFGWNVSGTHYLSSDPLPALPNVVLPRPLEFYTEYYFNEINPLFAIIHHGVFLHQFAAYKETIGSPSGSPKTPQEVKLFEAMLYLIVALSIRFTEFQKETDLSLEMLAIEEQLFKFSHKIVSTLSFQWESPELVQCWILITLYLRTTHRQSSYYFALGQATTMAKSTGINRSKRSHKIIGTPYEELKTTRIFWSLFSMERAFGIQGGRHQLLHESDLEREYPSLDFKKESASDTWITPASLAMIHIAKLSGFIKRSVWAETDVLKYQHINKELIELNRWLNDNGFSNSDLFSNPNEDLNSMVKAQVKLHYYDLVLAIHGKVLFNFVGRRTATPGLKIEMVLDSCSNVIEVMSKVHQAGRLYTPWYSNLLMLFTVGINSLVLINAGLYSPVARGQYSSVVELITILKKANVMSSDNKVLIKKRFKMADECLWALNTCSKGMELRFQQELQALQFAGSDPGPSDVNKATFSRYGFVNDNSKQTDSNEVLFDELSEIGRTGKRRRVPSRTARSSQANLSTSPSSGSLLPDSTQMPGTNWIPGNSSHSSAPSDGQSEVNEFNPNDPSFTNTDSGLYNNLLWFDQWFENANSGDGDVFLPPDPSTS